MTEALDQVTRLLDQGGRQWRSASMTVRMWTVPGYRSSVGIDWLLNQHGVDDTYVRRPPGCPPVETTVRAWAEWTLATCAEAHRVLRWREEELARFRARRFRSLLGSDGDTWWAETSDGGLVRNEGRDASAGLVMGPAVHLLVPTQVSVACRLSVLGLGEVSRRPVWRVRALPGDHPGPPPELESRRDFGFWEAEDYELAVDTQRGVLLRVQANSGGERIHLVEVQDIAFDGAPPIGWFQREVAGDGVGRDLAR